MTPSAPTPSPSWSQRLAPLVRGFHAYASWLVSISWKRFIVLSILLLIAAGMLQSLPPFSWTVREVVERPEAPRTPKPPREPLIHIEKGSGAERSVDIRIDSRGIRVSPGAAPAASSASAPSAASAPVEPAEVKVEVGDGPDRAAIRIALPPGATAQEVKEALESAREDLKEAARDWAEARRDAAEALSPAERVRRVHLGDFLTDLAALWIVASIIIKITYKRQMAAEAQAKEASQQAEEASQQAEAQQLQRQVVEARMAAMQAQVEPHFLFNTLASIDHLIETDPPRASLMQKSLIALLRATMPALRDAAAQGQRRTLGQEMAVIVPYLEILKMRMEDRLQLDIQVPNGLHTAEFPAMMVQTLVENAIKHGLEPKPEGGRLLVSAEVVDGHLQVEVQDSGVGLGHSPTAGTGTGLNNLRERLALQYGDQAQFSLEAAEGGGTLARIRLPYTACV